MCALYRKVVRLSPWVEVETTGKIVTLMRAASTRPCALNILAAISGAPIFIIGSFAMLYDVIEWSTFIGFL